MFTVPRYLRQREKGRPDRAFCLVNGKRHALGRYGSPESRQRYAELLSKLEAGESETAPVEPTPPALAAPTMSVLIAAYLKHAAQYYRGPDGKLSTEYGNMRVALRYVRERARHVLAVEFGPKLLKLVREDMIRDGLARKSINQRVGRIVRMMRWAAGEELIPASVYQNLQAVEGLRAGRSAAKETKPISAVSLEVVEATLPHLPELVADMVRLQLLTGMRSGELVQLRPCDVDRSGEVWWYTPADHKTAHLGKRRAVALGPQAQAVLRKYLVRGATMRCFRPCDSEAKRQADRAAKRKTPLSCGNRTGTHRVASPQRKAGDEYTNDSYRRAIARATKKAKLPNWHPHQLRHSAATLARREFSLDHVQALLGHSSAQVTELYAELDRAKAAEVARAIG